jgi:hypothetical protein
MSEEDLMTAVRAEFEPVRMDISADAIMSKGRATRRLRRGGVAAGALAVALGAGLGVPALTSGGAATGGAASGTTASGAPVSGTTAGGIELTAWTVAEQTNGSINVTIREMQDLPALNARLAADGARVVFGLATTSAGEAPPAGCLPASAVQGTAGVTNQTAAQTAVDTISKAQSYSVVVNPAKIPAGDMVRVAAGEGGATGVAGSPSLPGLFTFMVPDTAGCGF